MDESQYYTEDFWYNQLDKHDGPGYNTVRGYGSGYYAYKLYEQLIPQLDIPDTGAIVVLGTNRCVSFSLLCKAFGDRCIGFDIANPTGHPQVLIQNAMDLTANIPIAFVQLHAQKWAASNVIPGGYMLGRNNFNSRKYPLEDIMVQHGFTNLQLADSNYKLSNLDPDVITGHMLSRRT